MALEIEVKFKVTDRAAMASRIATAAGPPVGTLLERDQFFDTPDGALRRSDRGLRLRSERREGDPAPAQVTMTFKGPRAPGPLKQREEIQVGVEDMDSASALLERLGFVPTLVVCKRRVRWELGGCRAELDAVEGLGDYLEIEGPSAVAVEAAVAMLGLEREPRVMSSYAALVAAAGGGVKQG
jgi:adenylate cyclase class 2